MINKESNNLGITQLSTDILEKLSNIFNEYNNKILPLVAAIETLTGKFPGPVLNEIRACFSHIARCFSSKIDDNALKNELKKAYDHITRATLDCHKIMLIYYQDEVKDFKQQYKDVNLTLVDDGKFLPEFTILNDKARLKTIEAKSIENKSFPEKEGAYTAYEEALVSYYDVSNFIKKHNVGLANAKQHAKNRTKEENIRNWKFAIIGAIISAIISIVIGFLV
ncbi:MAG: hypothetical protein LBM25_07455 [Bacteroidales bacterium]|jgi:hypothetical protein|nr:hypothetical protein [Bacteroidales bacterium]